MSPPPPKSNDVDTNTTISNSGRYDSHLHQINQWVELFDNETPSDISDTQIFKLENFIKSLRKNAQEQGWSSQVKIAVNNAMAEVSSLSFMIKNRPNLRASPAFFHTILKLTNTLKVLRSVR